MATTRAATVPTAGIIALHNLPDLDTRTEGRRVLVNGAGGGVGAIALEVASAAGAEVTAVDHTRKLDLLRRLGADRVIDYTTDDVTRTDGSYDLVFDVGNHPFSAYRRVLAPDGTYVLVGHDRFGTQGRGWLGSIPTVFGLMVRSTVERRLPAPRFDSPDRERSMARLHDLVAREVLTPVVARTFPLEEVADAITMLASDAAPAGPTAPLLTPTRSTAVT